MEKEIIFLQGRRKTEGKNGEIFFSFSRTKTEMEKDEIFGERNFFFGGEKNGERKGGKYLE